VPGLSQAGNYGISRISQAWRLVAPSRRRGWVVSTRGRQQRRRSCVPRACKDVAQEKFVKHEWYAAGHPPLPGFDLASFEAQMPMHWRPLREKGAFPLRDSRPPQTARLLETQIRGLERAGVPPTDIKGNYREANFPAAGAGYDPVNDLPRAKGAIVAGAVVLEAYVRLLGDIAARSQEQQGAWPELAIFDCGLPSRAAGGSVQNRPLRRHAPVGRRWRRGRSFWPSSVRRMRPAMSRRPRRPAGRRYARSFAR
jgi:hypothetical protein